MRPWEFYSEGSAPALKALAPGEFPEKHRCRFSSVQQRAPASTSLAAWSALKPGYLASDSPLPRRCLSLCVSCSVCQWELEWAKTWDMRFRNSSSFSFASGFPTNCFKRWRNHSAAPFLSSIPPLCSWVPPSRGQEIREYAGPHSCCASLAILRGSLILLRWVSLYQITSLLTNDLGDHHHLLGVEICYHKVQHVI